MDQSEFSVTGATGNSNAFVTNKSAVPFFSSSQPVSSRLFLFAPVSLRYEHTISTNQKGTPYSLILLVKMCIILNSGPDVLSYEFCIKTLVSI